MQSSEDIQILGALPALFNSSRVTLHRLGIEKGGRFRKTLLLLISPRCPSVPTAVCPCGLQGTKRALHPLLPMWCTLQQGERSETCSSPHIPRISGATSSSLLGSDLLPGAKRRNLPVICAESRFYSSDKRSRLDIPGQRACPRLTQKAGDFYLQNYKT